MAKNTKWIQDKVLLSTTNGDGELQRERDSGKLKARERERVKKEMRENHGGK